MKILLYILILAGVLLFPSGGTDVGKLIPVEVLAISESNGSIVIATDTGDTGQGSTVQAAMDDLKATAPGHIYLDTAEYLILEAGMESDLNAIQGHLKGTVRVCCGEEGISLDGIADFLSVHGPKSRLKTVSNLEEIPTITEENGRYRMIEK